jgi:hypothetical protein
MSSEGTVERAALAIGRLLEPLGDRLQAGEVRVLFAELGLELPPELDALPGFATAMSAGAAAVGNLPPRAAELVTAIQNDDLGGIVSSGVALVDTIRAVIDATGTVAGELAGAAAALPGVDPADVAAFAGQLPEALFDYLVVRYLESSHPAALQVLLLLGLVEFDAVQGAPGDPTKPAYYRRSLPLDRVGQLLESPESVLRTLYGWGEPTFDGQLLVTRLADLLAVLGISGGLEPPLPGAPAVLETMPFRIGPRTEVAPPGLEVVVHGTAPASFTARFPLAVPGWEVEVVIEAALSAETGVLVQPPFAVTLIPLSGTAAGRVAVSLVAVPVAPATHVPLLNLAGGTGIDAAEVRLGLLAEFEWDLAARRGRGDAGLQGGLTGGRLRVGMDEADGFLAQLLAGFQIETDFDLGVTWTAGGGISFSGSSALEVQLPAHVALGPVEISAVTIGIGIEGDQFPTGLTADIKAALGPLRAVVEQVGASVDVRLPADRSGDLGPLDVGFSFKPPKGVGLSVDAGVVKGGGYLFIDVDKGEYAGALELVFSGFLTLKAIGLITTRLPDGSPGFSLLIIITAEFGTPIQLGFGFVLAGVGGLLGLNRAMKLDALAEGVRTGAINSVMFPENVIENAPRIISDLRGFFPQQDGVFLIGPMAKLGWGSPPLITASIGIIIEIPGNIAIVGVLKVVLPNEDAEILKLQVNLIGAIEFDKARLFFFAALFESRVLFITLEGEMGLLVSWGADATFVVTVGGFHPQFDPPPLPFPSPRRVALTILDESWGRIRVSGYFAVTSNTVQLGARADLFFGFSEFKIEGYLSFDALFQFNPFFFIIEISCGVDLKVFGLGLFSISLSFSLQGPTPWRAKGYGKLKLLFFSIKASFDFTWGEEQDTALPPVEVLPLLAAELANTANWVAVAPAANNLLVSLRPLPAGADALVLHPLGVLVVSQRLVPLAITIDKIGTQRPGDVTRLDVEVLGGLTAVGDADEPFAIAQFRDFTDAEKLSKPAFQPEKAGVQLAATDATLATGRVVERHVRYETVILDTDRPRTVVDLFGFFGRLFTHFLRGASVTRSPLSQHAKDQVEPFADRAAVADGAFVVASNVDNTPLDDQSVFTSEARAREYLHAQLQQNPALSGTVHVLPGFELNAV